MSKLFFVNVPYNSSERELKEWVESRGFGTRSIRIIRDLVAGVSPSFGYVELGDDVDLDQAISILNGKKMRNQTILVKEAPSRPASATLGQKRKSA
jgi:RNA recognition motif-containing protein